MRAAVIALAVSLTASTASAQDPAKTDADKYKVVLENERVRVLEYRDTPGDRTAQHHHPDFLMHVVSPFTRRLTFTDGRTMTRSFTAGEVVWMDAQTHIGENVGNTETHVLIVELKEPKAAQTPR